MTGRKRFCVYTHSANGGIFYVGSGTSARPYDRWGRTPRWRDHVKAVGNYDVGVHLWTDNRTEASKVENELIVAHAPTCNFWHPDKHSNKPRFEMRVSPELLAEIDAWAKAQPGNPPRATAVKRLIAMALEAEERKAKPRPKK